MLTQFEIGRPLRLFSTLLAACATGVPVKGQTTPSELAAPITVDRAEAGLRGRYLDVGPHAVTQRNLHYKFTGRFTANLTRSGDVYLRMRAETGDAFNNDHNYTSAGLGTRCDRLNVKNLYAGWRLSEQVELQAGGIDYEYGSGTQATYADVDGWLEGYRLTWKKPGAPAMLKLSATAGYIGDFRQPDFFRRLNRFNQVNYMQLLAESSVGKNASASVEVSTLTGIPYFRSGIRRNTRQLKIIDDIVIESIFRTSHNAAAGWSSTVSRRLDARKRWRVIATYSHIPQSMFCRQNVELLQNGDSMGLGKRLGATLYFAPAPNWEIIGFASRRLDATPGVRNRAQLVVRYQFASLLNHLLGAARRR